MSARKDLKGCVFGDFIVERFDCIRGDRAIWLTRCTTCDFTKIKFSVVANSTQEMLELQHRALCKKADLNSCKKLKEINMTQAKYLDAQNGLMVELDEKGSALYLSDYDAATGQEDTSSRGRLTKVNKDLADSIESHFDIKLKEYSIDTIHDEHDVHMDSE